MGSHATRTQSSVLLHEVSVQQPDLSLWIQGLVLSRETLETWARCRKAWNWWVWHYWSGPLIEGGGGGKAKDLLNYAGVSSKDDDPNKTATSIHVLNRFADVWIVWSIVLSESPNFLFSPSPLEIFLAFNSFASRERISLSPCPYSFQPRIFSSLLDISARHLECVLLVLQIHHIHKMLPQTRCSSQLPGFQSTLFLVPWAQKLSYYWLLPHISWVESYTVSYPVTSSVSSFSLPSSGPPLPLV